MFLGILACFVFVSIGVAVASLGLGIYSYVDSKNRAEDAEKKNEEQMLKQERKAKVMHLKQFNRALAAYNTGALLAKRNLVQAKRERAYNYGKTNS